jgi:hypothetical protein
MRTFLGSWPIAGSGRSRVQARNRFSLDGARSNNYGETCTEPSTNVNGAIEVPDALTSIPFDRVMALFWSADPTTLK